MRLRENVTRRRIRPHRTLRGCARGSCSSPLVLVARRLRRRRPASDRPERDRPTLLLDFTPNAVHAGIYVATDARLRHRRGRPARDPQAGRLDRRAEAAAGRGAPTWRSSTSTTSGSRARRARDLVGVMAFVQRPLAAVLAQPGIRTPEGPRGRARRRQRAAVGRRGAALGRRRARAGDPDAGARDDDRLRGGQGAARQAGRGRDRVLERRGRGAEGAAARDPRVPRRRLRRALLPGARADASRGRRWRRQPAVVRATIRALQRGYSEVQNDPESAVSAMTDARARTSTAPRSSAQLDAVAPAFTAGADAFGELRPAVLRAWAAWDARVRDPAQARSTCASLRHDARREAEEERLISVSVGRCPRRS